MSTTLPPGYTGLIAVDSKAHRDKRLVRQRQAFAAGLISLPLMAAEFTQAARQYPIVFAEDAREAGEFVPLAVTGVEAGRNLFVDQAGVWEPGTYQPAHVRCWPFYGAHVNDGRHADLVICVDPAGLSANAEGEALFEAGDTPGPALRTAQTLIRDIESARVVTRQFCRTLRAQNLLAPFEAHALPKRGAEWRVRGMYRVDENRLNALDATAVKDLMREGWLSRIYAHLMSLDNFKILMDRVVARTAGVTTH